MYVTTVPVIDRIIAESRARQGGQSFDEWLNRLQGEVAELGLMLDEGETDDGALFDQHEIIAGLLEVAPTPVEGAA